MISTIINSPELSAGFIILSAYVVIVLILTALCTLTVKYATKRINRPVQAITAQARGNRQINHNRQRKIA